MDTFEISLFVVPITAPAILMLDVNPIWLGVMIGVNLQTSFLTPPVGFALFYLRDVAPPSVTTGHIYSGIVPLDLKSTRMNTIPNDKLIGHHLLEKKK